MISQDESQRLTASMNHGRTRRRTDKDMRRLMQKFDELIQDSILLQNVFIKLWKLLVKTQHRDEFSLESREGGDKETKSKNLRTSGKTHES